MNDALRMQLEDIALNLKRTALYKMLISSQRRENKNEQDKQQENPSIFLWNKHLRRDSRRNSHVDAYTP